MVHFSRKVARTTWANGTPGHTVVQATDEDGQPFDLDATGMQARVIQHEMDHLEGVLFIDLLTPVARDRIKKRIQKHGFPKERRSRAFAL